MITEKNKEKLYDGLFCTLILCLPYFSKIPNILLIFLSVFFIADYKVLKTINFKALKSTPLLIFLLLILYWLVKSAITNTIGDNKYGLFLPMFLIPFLLLKVKNYQLILYTIVFTGFIITSVGLFGAVNYFFTHNTLLPFEGKLINEVLYMERPYLGFFLVIASIVTFQIIKSGARYQYLFIANGFYMIFFVFLISARLSVLTIIVVLLIYLTFYFKISIIKRIIFLGGVLSVFIISFFLNQNLKERMFVNNDIEKSYLKLKRHEPRFIIWPCAYEIASKPEFNKIFGISSKKEIDTKLIECYDTKLTNRHRAEFFIKSRFNTHNQFLGIYLNSGILGLIGIFSFFFLQLYKFRKMFVSTTITLSLFLFFIVENVLFRQVGVYFFIILVSMVNIINFEGGFVDRRTENNRS